MIIYTHMYMILTSRQQVHVHFVFKHDYHHTTAHEYIKNPKIWSFIFK